MPFGGGAKVKKQDLQNFDVVETRTGDLYMVNADRRVLFGIDGWMPLDDYGDDLTDLEVYEEARYYDILRVRRPSDEHQCVCRQWDEAPIVWERKEEPTLTEEEFVSLEILRPELWIARDKCGDLYLYNEEPNKYEYEAVWDAQRSYEVEAPSDEFLGFIKWEDDKPWQISGLLELEVE